MDLGSGDPVAPGVPTVAGTLPPEVLLELALSFGGETDPREMLAQTLPLLVRRTSSTAVAVLHRCRGAWETVHVAPAVLAGQPAWTALRERVEALAEAEVRAGTAVLPGTGRVHHVLPLPGYGRLVLTRTVPLPADFTRELVRVLAVFARPLVADHEARRRAEAELDLHDLGQRQRALLDTLPHPTWLCDADGRYLEVNEAFLAWVGRRRAEVIGATPAEVLPRDGRAELAAVRRVCATGTARTDLSTDPDTGRTFQVQRTPYLDASARPVGVVGFRHDLTDQRASLRRVQRSEDRLRRVVAATDEGWWDSDLASGEAYLSERWWRIHGYEPGELATTIDTWWHLTYTHDRAAVDTTLARAVSQQLPRVTLATRVQHKQGHAVPVVIRAFLTYDATGALVRASGSTTDVSVLQQAHETRDLIVSTVSHELRTPLTAIGGALELIGAGRAGPVPERIDELLSLASRNTRRLTMLINDLLDIEQLSTGRSSFTMETQPLAPLVERALEDIATFPGPRPVSFAFTTRRDEVLVTVDADRTVQVLTNYLSNAAKFAPAESLVEVQMHRAGARVRTEVVDRGPGVPVGFRARAFQRFAQADPRDGRSRGGTGLGLAITREIVTRMGGEVGYDSEPGHTRFWFELPVVDVEAAP